MNLPVVVLAGSTGSGKTGLAIALSNRFSAEIVCSDSQQIYRDLDIGTAKPSKEEMDQAPHHLYGVVDPLEQVNAADFVRLADLCVAEIHGRSSLPLIVGGTGLWIRALMRGLAQAPPRNEALRVELEALARDEGVASLHARLAALDPEASSRLHPNDLQRVIRAIEVAAGGGPSLSARQAAHGFRAPRYEALQIALSLPRELLRHRIRARCRLMIDAGWIEETQRLLDRGLRERLRKVLGYAQILQVIDGELAESELFERICSRTWAYAKRQQTWLRGVEEFRFVDAEDPRQALATIASEIQAFIERPRRAPV